MVATLTIFHSNDLHSRVDSWTRMESLVKRLGQEVGPENFLRLDAGDHGDRSFQVTEGTQGRANMALLAAANVDAFTFGNNECLVWSVDHQAELAQSVPFPVLAADLRLANGDPIPGTQDWAIIRRAGLKIGLFGLSRDVEDFLAPLGLVHGDPTTVATECVGQLRQEGCDLVIFLSHLGYENDKAIASRVPGIDVIVGGHSHTALTHGEQVAGTVIVQAGSYGQYLGRLDLTIQAGRVAAWQATLLETAGEPPDPTMQDLLSLWEDRSMESMGEVIAYLPMPLPHDPLGESPLAELMARRLQVKYDADIALVHGGVLLSGLPAGPLTKGDLLKVCPCMLNPVVAPISGRKLLDLLALPAAAFAQKASRNGMRGDTVVGRIFGVGLDAIDPERVYRVALNDYLAFGFDPFLPLRGTHTVMEMASTEQLLRDTLAEALTGQAFVPGQVVQIEAYDLDGRLRKYWDVHMLKAGPDRLVLGQRAGFPLKRPDDSPWTCPWEVDYYFWPGREYNQFRFFEPNGHWKGDYYNVALPFVALRDRIAYVDLELDVSIESGKGAVLLDEDELEAAPYSEAMKAHIQAIAASLKERAGTDQNPAGPIYPRPDRKDFCIE